MENESHKIKEAEFERNGGSVHEDRFASLESHELELVRLDNKDLI